MRFLHLLLLVAITVSSRPCSTPLVACAAVGPPNKPVVNADQTVIILWDAAKQTQHFIRQASFKGEAADFGFLVPSPSQPEMEEAGDGAFPYLAEVTAPEIRTEKLSGGGCGCSPTAAPKARGVPASAEVRVLQEKMVAGFQTAVLEADTANALVGWLKEHGYAFSPEVEAWAKPYVGAGWKITAFKVAMDANENRVATAALRLSFKTDRPLFPYREPDYKGAASTVGANSRMLRIFFLGEARYEGQLTKEQAWTGKAAWAGQLKSHQRTRLLELLKLPPTTGPDAMWLTEFEDAWPYMVAPADVYFAKDRDQGAFKRDPHIQYVSNASPADAAPILLAMLIFVPRLVRRRWRQQDKA